jgi:hypothetical protein
LRAFARLRHAGTGTPPIPKTLVRAGVRDMVRRIAGPQIH